MPPPPALRPEELDLETGAARLKMNKQNNDRLKTQFAEGRKIVHCLQSTCCDLFTNLVLVLLSFGYFERL